MAARHVEQTGAPAAPQPEQVTARSTSSMMTTGCDSSGRFSAVEEQSASRAQAWVVVVVLAAIIGLVVVTLSYSTVNTPFSIDGKKAQLSHNLPSGK